ncbi:hypothetical protein AB0I22_35675 [Streptomyces sp. NPDC050610]|uniref:hypothetical protein n=1 Tax=Streptomyces sp. NPDC050610 TaxID=3157097 RepID=UPI00342BBEC8
MTDEISPAALPLESSWSPDYWLYSAGQWTRLDHDPVPDTPTADGDWAQMLQEAGFRSWYEVAAPPKAYNFPIPLELCVYERSTGPRPRFAVELRSDLVLTVFCEELPDLMDLLAKWAPTVHALAAASQIAKEQAEYG